MASAATVFGRREGEVSGPRDGVNSGFGLERRREMGNGRGGTLEKDVYSYGTPVASDEVK